MADRTYIAEPTLEQLHAIDCDVKGIGGGWG